MEFFIALLLLTMSSIDVSSDYKVADSYLEGTNYLKLTTSQTFAESQNCTWVGTILKGIIL